MNQLDPLIAGGAVFVHSTGNDSKSNPSITAGLPTFVNQSVGPAWLAVAAYDESTGKLASYSNACGAAAAYCLVAPGTVSLASPHAYGAGTGSHSAPNAPVSASGTSLATPMVSATAALVWQAFPWLTNAQVGETILGTATPMGTGVGDATYGWGLLNTGSAVQGPQNLAWGTFDANASAGTYTFGNNMFGAGGFTKDGPGTLILAGNNAYLGATTVNAGALEVDGTIRSAVTVAAGGTLSGSGIVSGNVTENGTLVSGRLSAGAGSVNTGLSVLGTVTFAPTANYGVVVGSPLKAEAAVLGGSSAQVLGVANGYTPQGTETILWTQNGVSGTFGSVTAGSGVTLSATPVYKPNEVDLTITSLSAPAVLTAAASSGNVTLSANTLSAAGHVQALLDAANPVAHAVLSAGSETSGQAQLLTAAGWVQQALSAQALETSVNSLSGAAHPTAVSLERANLDTTNGIFANHLSALSEFSGAGIDTPFGTAWAAFTGGGVRLGSGASGASSTSHGLVSGLDTTVAPGFTVGLGVQSSQVDAGTTATSGRDTIHDTGLSVDAQWAPADTWYANARLGTGVLRTLIEHTDLLGAVAQRAQARYNGRYATLDFETGWRLHPAHALTITPVAALHADRVHTDGFAETGVAAFGLAAAGQSTARTAGTLGLRAREGFSAWNGVWSLDAHASWTHTFSGNNPTLRAFYEGNPTNVFGVTGAPLARSSWDLGADLSARWGNAWTVAVGYDAVTASEAKGHAASVSLSWMF